MPTTSAAVLASGTATAAKLFVAALAFTSAYVGLSAYGHAGTTAPPATTITLSARELPVSTPAAGQPATAGEVTVGIRADAAAGCLRTYVARSLVLNPRPAEAVSLRWKLARWSPTTKGWRTYLAGHDSFAAARRAVEWRPHISANPGWYRVELAVEGAGTLRSGRFQVSC
ncbi:hypothetical protein ACWEPC_15305 [Nonomuraea sp. NPDC004297]